MLNKDWIFEDNLSNHILDINTWYDMFPNGERFKLFSYLWATLYIKYFNCSNCWYIICIGFFSDKVHKCGYLISLTAVLKVRKLSEHVTNV